MEQVHILDEDNVGSAVAAADLTNQRALTEIQETKGLLEGRSEVADNIVPVLDLFRDGVLMMDEVDVLLHPLKSELNFPIGAKDPIDLSGDRWELPIHLAEAIFSIDHVNRDETPEMAAERLRRRSELAALREPTMAGWQLAEIRSEVSYKDMLATLGGALQSGKDNHKLQSIPHLVLLDPAYYSNELQQLMARWSLLWLHRALSEDLTMCVPNETIQAYIAGSCEADLGSMDIELLKQSCTAAGIRCFFVVAALSRRPESLVLTFAMPSIADQLKRPEDANG